MLDRLVSYGRYPLYSKLSSRKSVSCLEIFKPLERRVSNTSHERRGAVRRDVAFVRQGTTGKGDQRQPCSTDLRVQRQNAFDLPQISSEAQSDAVLS
jgi:hypothetical protein